MSYLGTQDPVEHLKRFMALHDLNPRSWCLKANVNPNTLYNYFKGRSRGLSQSTLMKLSAAANVSLDALLPQQIIRGKDYRPAESHPTAGMGEHYSSSMGASQEDPKEGLFDAIKAELQRQKFKAQDLDELAFEIYKELLAEDISSWAERQGLIKGLVMGLKKSLS